MIALDMHVWRPGYLIHDFEKPWMKLFMEYKNLQQWHRTHNRHHVEYNGAGERDYLAMVIDWECSRFTKEAEPKNARETLALECKKLVDLGKSSDADILKSNVEPILDKLGL